MTADGGRSGGAWCVVSRKPRKSIDGSLPSSYFPHPTSHFPHFALLTLPLLFLGYFFLYPLVRILWLSLSETGFARLLDRPRFAGVAWFTFWQAVVSTVLTLLAALPLTWALSRFNFRGKPLVRAVVTVPFVLPTVVVGAAFLSILGRGLPALLAAHVFYNVAVVVRTVGGVWARIDRRVEESATVLGAGPMKVFRTITLPLLRPAIASAASIVFLFCFTSFGTVLILGGGLRTLEVEIYQQAVSFLDLPVAGALSVIQLTTVLCVLLISSRLQASTSRLVLAPELDLPRPRSATQRTRVFGVVGLSLIGLAIPLASLTAVSLRDNLIGWRSLWSSGGSALRPLAAIAHSLSYALVAMVIAVFIGGAAAAWLAGREGGSWFDALVMLPLGTSAVTIGFGFLIALDKPIDLRGSWILVPLAHALVAVPFVVRTSLPVLRAIRQDLREAATVLGASPSRVFREIDLPIATRAFAVGAGFAALVSLGEFGATAFVVRPASITVPALIYRLLGRPGSSSFATAMALAVILAILTTGLVLVVDRLRGTRAEAF